MGTLDLMVGFDDFDGSSCFFQVAILEYIPHIPSRRTHSRIAKVSDVALL
jgi:hypothetical protein